MANRRPVDQVGCNWNEQEQEAEEITILSPRTSSRRLQPVEASMERIEKTFNEILQRLEAAVPRRENCDKGPTNVQQWGRQGIQGVGCQRLGQNHQERGIGINDHRRINQEFQEPHHRFQDCN